MVREMLRRARDELWRLVVGGVGAVAGFVLFWLALASLLLIPFGGLGIPLFVGTTGLIRWLAAANRRWASRVLGEPVASPYAEVPPGLLAAFRSVILDKATWRDAAWLASNLPISVSAMAIGVGLWASAVQAVFAPALRAALPPEVVFDPLLLEVTNQPRAWLMVLVSPLVVVLAYRLPRWLITVRAWLVRWLLAPTTVDRLAARVDHLAATRTDAVDTSAAELRRIERDLHDGPQARLVSLAMKLGMAEDVVDRDPGTAKDMLGEARVNANAAITELRDLVRGIHPPVLAERGLSGAVQALALNSPIPVDLELRVDRRLAAPEESTAYFVIAEAMANAIRHSGASRLRIAIEDAGKRLLITVTDDGSGGADPAKGTGIPGIRRRLAAFDGTLAISSPPLGPTTLHAEMQCGS